MNLHPVLWLHGGFVRQSFLLFLKLVYDGILIHTGVSVRINL